ncbi:hypothetical protein FM037_08315 [Shewanella psychropiezotolerans]|uniref:Uncharacterized protein n=1 Tax=Shewanella psychropiezotolerans TaxID=2593655 RepID=A0ABX5WVV1_9GAMM|nr:hypothetical protein [Shewanella psychropiezotolerans]QDO83232.1 hypothetical protein FM037_08315 [Shewanella psychropiezotolerans]
MITTIFEASAWLQYERVLIILSIFLISCTLLHYKYKRNIPWKIMSLTAIFASALITSRISALEFDGMLANPKNIEIVNGLFHHGEYRFTDIASDSIDYREIRLSDRMIKLYHSGYMYSSRCYRKFFSSNSIEENSKLRMYIYWFEHDYIFNEKSHKLKTPCILKIEQVS